jgi:rubrerythrin
MARRGERGGGGAEGGSTEAGQGAPDGERESDPSTPLLSEVEVLMALAQLDLESALAYDAAAELVDDGELAQQLREFAEDHRRHLQGIGRVLAREGGEGLEAPGSKATGLLAELTRISGPLGEEALVLTLLANEQITNLTYEDALAYEWGGDEERMLERFRADEERHMRWLSDRHDVLHGPPRPPAPGAPA